MELLDLRKIQLSGTVPTELGNLVLVKKIILEHNQLVSSSNIPLPFLIALTNCSQLEFIKMSYNHLSGVLPRSIGHLSSKLSILDFGNNQLRGTIPTSLTNMKVLRYFNACFNNLTGEDPKRNLPEHACPNQGKKLKSPLTKTMLSAAGVIAFLLCISIFGILCSRRYSSTQFDLPDFMFGRLRYPRLTYQELVNATNGFNETNLLGVGSFGSVFKGILRDVCYKWELGKLLYPESNEEDGCEVNIDECLNIAIYVAHGMEYLHHDCPIQVIHCDLKPSNVLLDANMTALVADFGISRLAGPTNLIDSLSTSIAMRGFIGYIAPGKEQDLVSTVTSSIAEYGLGMNTSTSYKRRCL
ncbi:putative receptor-like protein kinase At3g47110 [Cryptomeria japonica]|uniref:putative receptor-like protein kinase At3g47110 n=1 Tax=Cryptomeria japonica TaxID=3369 RepID=UPI0027DA918F|nr:putative receptor-like protein kinase At3g47110 [Cryptomeria japonica]